jgi:hypothetical protein
MWKAIGTFLWKWNQHDVTLWTPWFVRKKPNGWDPNTNYSYALASLQFLHERVADVFLPRTRIKSQSDDSYTIIQKEVKWWIPLSELKDLKLLSLSTRRQLQDFLAIVESIESEWIQFDLLGCPSSQERPLFFTINQRHKEDLIFADTLPIPLANMVKLYSILRVYISRIQREGDIMKSSNIMVDLKGNIKFIDTVMDVRAHNAHLVVRIIDRVYKKYMFYIYNKQLSCS